MRNLANSVGTYNIVITSNKQTALSLTKFESYKRFMEVHATDEDAVFLSTGGEKLQESMQTPASQGVNILEFSHVFNYAGGGKNASKDSGFTIKTHEAGLGFLKKLFFMSTGESLTFLKERKSYINELNKSINTLAEDYDRKYGQGSISDPNAEAKTPEQSRYHTQREQLKSVVARNAQGQKVYIAYGIGDDMKYWAGPFQSILGETQYSNDGKKETITYFFSSDQVKHLYDGKTVLDLSKAVSKETSNKFSIPVQAYDFVPQEAALGINRALLFDAYADIVEWDGYAPSIHDCVVKLISYYLHSIGVKNHIIVLPNLDQLLSPYITNVLKEEVVNFEDDENEFVSNALFSGGDIDALKISKTDPTRLGAQRRRVRMTRQYIKALQRVLSNLGGLSSDLTSGAGSSDVNPKLVTFQKGSPDILDPTVNRTGDTDTAIFDYVNQIKIQDPFSDAATTPLADGILNLGLDLTQWEGQIEYTDNTGTLKTKGDGLFTFDENNYAEPIKQFIQGILGAQGQQLFDVDYFFESNLGMCELFKKKFGSGTFTGYKDARGNRANYSTSPRSVSDDAFFVFGDRSLIDQYLYGHIQQVVDYNKRFRSVEFLQEKQFVGLVNSNTGNKYFLDPFWNRITEDIAQLEQVDPNQTTSEYLKTLESTYFGQAQALIYKGAYTPLGFFNDYASKSGDFRKNLPDEFGFLTTKTDDSPTTILEQVEALRIPFFIANEKNSNVLSFNIDADNFLLSQFLGTIGEIYHEVALRYSKLSQISQGIPSSSAIDAKLYEVIDSWRERGFYGKGFHSFFPTAPSMSLTQFSTDLKDILLLETEGPTKNLRKNYSSPYIAMLSLFVGLYEKRYKGIIKTLPMFNLANVANIQKPAIALLKSTPRLKTSSELDRSTADFFSGLYKILGWKHSITKSKAESEFVVVKDIRSEVNDAED